VSSAECPTSDMGTAVSLGTAANTSAMPGSASMSDTQCLRRDGVILWSGLKFVGPLDQLTESNDRPTAHWAEVHAVVDCVLDGGLNLWP
jgi:hypothetical protein